MPRQHLFNLNVIVLLATSLVLPTVLASGEMLDTRIERVSFETRGIGMQGVVGSISNATGVPTGFVAAPDYTVQTFPMETFTRERASIRELFDACVAMDPQYEWIRTSSQRVVVLPRALRATLESKVADVSLKDVSLMKAQRELWTSWNETLESKGLPIHGMILSMWSEHGGGTPMDRLITVDIKNACALDLMNKSFDAAGNDLSWCVGKGYFTAGNCFQSRVRTVEVAAAQDYLYGGTLDSTKALTLLDQAIETAPFEPLRQRLRYLVAQVELGKEGQYAGNLEGAPVHYEVAEKIFRELVDHPSRDAGVHPQSLEYLVRVLMAEGRKQEAKDLLDRFLNDQHSDLYFSMEALREQRLALPF